MTILDELERFQEAALKNKSLRERILRTRTEEEPVTEGFEIYEMDLVYAGEEAYSAMKRSTNGGGENSPMLQNEDDYYSLFIAAMEAAK